MRLVENDEEMCCGNVEVAVELKKRLHIGEHTCACAYVYTEQTLKHANVDEKKSSSSTDSGGSADNNNNETVTICRLHHVNINAFLLFACT